MTKNEAQRIWDREVKETVKEWRKEFKGKPIDPLYVTCCLWNMRLAVIETLQIADSWRAFQNAVKEKEKDG